MSLAVSFATLVTDRGCRGEALRSSRWLMYMNLRIGQRTAEAVRLQRRHQGRANAAEYRAPSLKPCYGVSLRASRLSASTASIRFRMVVSVSTVPLTSSTTVRRPSSAATRAASAASRARSATCRSSSCCCRVASARRRSVSLSMSFVSPGNGTHHRIPVCPLAMFAIERTSSETRDVNILTARSASKPPARHVLTDRTSRPDRSIAAGRRNGIVTFALSIG